MWSKRSVLPTIPRLLRLLPLLLVLPASAVWGELRITELLPKDNSTLPDEDAEHTGWVELLNTGSLPVSLKGYGLSDDETRPFRWTFPDVTLDAGNRLVVFTSGKDRFVPAGPTNAPAELTPAQISGLQWWVDASDTATLTVTNGRVAQWRDKTGQSPPDKLPPPLSPDALPGKVLWLDAADADSLTLSGASVTHWQDKSGTANHAAQPTASAQPKRAIKNNLSVLRFDGDDDQLKFPKDVPAQTLVWVGLESTNVALTDRRPFVGHTGKFDFLRGANGSLLGFDPGVAPGIREAQVYLNGKLTNQQTTPLPNSTMNVVIIVGEGPGVFNNLADDRGLPRTRWWGDVAEVIAFDRALEQDEIIGLDRHLKAKWGIPDLVPPDYSALQSRPEMQPSVSEDPLTGLPGVHFDGMDDRMLFPEVSPVQTIIAVIREDEYATDAYRTFLSHPSATYLTRGGDGLLTYGSSPLTSMDGLQVNPLITRLPSRRLLLSFQFGVGVSFDRLAMDRTYDDQLFEGDIHEVMLFNRALTATERAGLAAHLNRKWRLPDRRLHANFNLKNEGELLLLTDPEGHRVDTAPALMSRADGSYGRLADKGEWVWFGKPSPGKANPPTGVQLGITPPPWATPPPGFRGGATSVELRPATNSPADTRIYYTLDGSEPTTSPENLWFDDTAPPGAQSQALNDNGWNWGATNPVPISGTRSLRSGTVAGLHQFTVTLAQPLPTGTTGQIHFELWCDPLNPPRTVMLQFLANSSWNHRVFWGDNLINYGQLGTPGRFRAGGLPAAGRWVRLTVKPSDLGLIDSAVQGVAFTLFDGRAAFDSLGYSPGSLPTLYTGPLPLTRDTVIRARATAPGYLASDIFTGSFVLHPGGNLPVVSLSTAPGNFFDSATGIYTAGPSINEEGQHRQFNYQRNWERPVHAELYEPDGSPGVSLDCGVKIHGAFSRHWPQRSLRLHFRQRYGEKALQYPVFPGYSVQRFDSLILRNGGNDWSYAFLRDEFGHSLAADIELGHQSSRPAHVFINGAYWGVLTLREHATADTVRRQHGLDSDLDMIKNEIEVVSGDRANYAGLISTAVATVGNPAHQPLLASMISATNYWDWLATELFAGNIDWPGNNMMTWRPRGNAGLWHWMLVDIDGGFVHDWVTTNTVEETLASKPLTGLVASSLVVMRGLLNQADYRRDFANRVSDLLNTTFSTNHTVPRLAEMESFLEPAMPAQIARWKDSVAETLLGPQRPTPLQSMASWHEKVGDVRQFLLQRPLIFREYIRDFFDLGQDVSMTFAASPATGLGRWRIGTLEPDPEKGWTATYFAGLPLQLSVAPAPGYKVIGWSDGQASTNTTRTVTAGAVATLTVLLGPDDTQRPPFPLPHSLAAGDFTFNAWPATSPAGSYPPAMAFEISSVGDPGLNAALNGFWTNRYDLGSRSRVLGEGSSGVSFINTSDPQTTGDYVSGALLALDTTGVKDVTVTWTGGTVLANSRNYGLRLQWRSGTNAPFADVLDAGGLPVEYLRHADGHFAVLGPVRLPAGAENQPLVQLRWRYYSISQAGDSGARARLRLDDVRISAVPSSSAPSLAISITGQGLMLSVTAPAGASCTFWSSDDMVNWNQLTSGNANANGKLNFTVNVTEGHRYYQARLP